MMKRIAAKVRANLAMFWSVLKNEGALPCMECVVRRVGATALGMSPAGHPRMNLMLFRMTDVLYDRIHKVDTGGSSISRRWKGTARTTWPLRRGRGS